MNKREKTLILNSTSITKQLFIPILQNYKENNILIINYIIDMDNRYIQEILESENFNSFEIFKPKSKNIKVFKEKIDRLNSDDLVFFIGIEYLFLDTSKDIFALKTNKRAFNYKSYEDIDFLKVIRFINYLYFNSKTNLIFVATTLDKDISKRVTNELNAYDIKIMSMIYQNDNDSNDDEFNKIYNEVYNAITHSSYEEALSILEKYKKKMSKNSFRQVKVAILIQHGFIKKAMNVLSYSYKELNYEEQITLADLYFENQKYQEAFLLAKKVFEESPLTLDAPYILLRIVIALDIVEEWYMKIIEVDTMDKFVFERLANYFTEIKNFKRAINLRNHLFKITKKPLHLMLIEILKVEDNKPKNGHIVEKNILKIVDDYKDDEELQIEASFNLGRTWLEIYNSPYKAYYHFKDVLKKCNNPRAVTSAEYRMELLSNQGYSDKIIKPKYQEKYPEKLPTMRVNELLNSILILNFNNTGYITWQNFINNSQTTIVWKKFLMRRTITELKKLDTSILNSYIKKSSIFNELKDSKIILSIRLYKNEASFIEEFNFKQNHQALISMCSNLQEQVWARYYIVLYFAVNGEPQLANNHAISLWFIADSIKDDENLSLLARNLATLAWGVTQYRNRKEIEGIACILVTIKYFIKIEEVLPFMEDALGILNIWMQMNKELLIEKDITFFKIFFKELTKEHIIDTDVSEYLIIEDWKSIYNKLGYKIYNSREYDSQWGLDFYNYVVASSKLDKVDINLILNNIDNIIDSLKTRKDGRAKILYVLANIIFGNANNYQACLKLLNVSIEDSEEQREKFKNTYERSFLSDSNRDIYQLYLTINILRVKEKSHRNNKNQFLNVLKAFDYLSPRILTEKRESIQNEKPISKEIENVEKEYLKLIDDLSQYGLKNFDEAYRTDEYKTKSDRYAKLRDILEREHTTYRNDKLFEDVPIQLIQGSLKEDEVYYQYVNVNSFICYLLITRDFIDISINKTIHIKKDMDKLSLDLQDFTKTTTYDINDIYNSYYEVSKKYFNPLLNLYKNYKKIYINVDLTLPLLSSNLIRLKDSWLIEEVDCIVNITNKNYFTNSKKVEKSNFKITTLGKKSDKQMIDTRKWIESNEERKNIFINDFERQIDNMKFQKSDNLLIVSHGIQGTHHNNLTGSLSIDGAEKSYTISDLKFINDLNCIYFLTCSSGSVSIGEHETSNSILNNVLSKNINSVILCKWDVFLDVSLEISDKLIQLSKNQPVEYALNQALKEILKNPKWQHPVYWAGIEIWKN